MSDHGNVIDFMERVPEGYRQSAIFRAYARHKNREKKLQDAALAGQDNMSKQVDGLKQKIRNAPHQSKPSEASLVVYDCEGRWLFEVYGGSKGPLHVSTQQEGE